MKLLFTLALAAVTGTAQAEMKPLAEVVGEAVRSDVDLAHVAYLYKRCAGLYTAMAGLSDSGMKPAMVEKFEAAAAERLLHAMTLDAEKQKENGIVPDAKKIREGNIRALTAIAKMYRERMDKNYLESSSYAAEDSVLMAELKICVDPLSAIKTMMLERAKEAQQGAKPDKEPGADARAFSCAAIRDCPYYWDFYKASPSFRNAFAAAMGQVNKKVPSWIPNGTASPVMPITIAASVGAIGSICEPHNCPHQVVTIFYRDSQRFVGMYIDDQDKLFWLGLPTDTEKKVMRDFVDQKIGIGHAR